MSEQYWVFADGKMKFITWEGGNYDGVCDYIESCFPEIGMNYEFGEMTEFKDFRITPTIVKDDEEKEKGVELINGKFLEVDNDPLEVEEIMIETQKSMGELGTLHTGKIYFHNEDTGDIYDPTEEKEEGWTGHNVIYKMKNLKYIKDEEVSRVIQYKPNRALVFPAKIMHYADAPSRFYNGLRISLAYKLKV